MNTTDWGHVNDVVDDDGNSIDEHKEEVTVVQGIHCILVEGDDGTNTVDTEGFSEDEFIVGETPMVREEETVWDFWSF